MSAHLPDDELADLAADLSEVTRLLAEHDPAAEMPTAVSHRLEAVLLRETARRSARRPLTAGLTTRLAARAAAVLVGLRRSIRSADDRDR